MRIYRYIWTLLALFAVGGCAGVVNQERLTSMKAANEGILLVHMTFDGQSTNAAMMTITQPDASGKYTHVAPIDLWLPLAFNRDSGPEPAQLPVAAGDYGIFAVNMHGKIYRAKRARGLYPVNVSNQPIATFTVRAGEVVDIGTLHISTGMAPQGLLGISQPSFSIQVGPIPPERLQNLAKRNPEVASARVVRPMIVPGRS